MNNREGIVHKYLRWSKRIVLFGLIQWSVISFVVFCFVGVFMKYSIPIDDQTQNIFKTILTSSSSLAITSSLAYLGHSSIENIMNKKMNQAMETEMDNVITGGEG